MPYEWAIKAGKSERIARELEHDVWFSKESLKKLKPVPGSFKFLNWFIDREIEIPIITSRMPDLDTR